MVDHPVNTEQCLKYSLPAHGNAMNGEMIKPFASTADVVHAVVKIFADVVAEPLH